MTPAQTIAGGYCCPACGKKVTVGVLHRVELLADRAEGVRPAGAPPFRSIIPLSDLIGGALGIGTMTKRAQALYFGLLQEVGNEFHVLMDAPLDAIAAASSATIAHAIGKMRTGDLEIVPGYDGEFGKISVPRP